GVVPSEIFARAHAEALKAQAVTARGEVLAKIGARHLGDPYLLCAEQHCQVYKGVAAEQAGPDAAVEATRGEALFAEQGGQSRLVDSVYSAVCGGFTEDNDAVWSGPADPSLRGRPDFDPLAPGMAPFRDGVGEALVSRFVHLDPFPSYCAASGFANPDKVRWRRTFTQREVDEICASLGVGTVHTLAVEGRGVSGRARALRVAGSRASARVYGELQIRRLFRNLHSGMFVLERAGSGRRRAIPVAVPVAAHRLLRLAVARDAIFHAPKHVVPQIVSLVTSDRSQLQGIRPGGPQTTAAAPQQQIPRLPVAPVPPPEK